MEKTEIKLVIAFVVITCALFLSCKSGGGNEGNTKHDGLPIVISIDDRTNGAKGFYTGTGSGPVPPASTAITAVDGLEPDVVVTFKGGTPGTYTIEDGDASFSYSDSEGQVYAARDILDNTEGTIIVTEMGDVGEPITGNFVVTADRYDGSNPSGQTVMISGTFKVTRQADH